MVGGGPAAVRGGVAAIIPNCGRASIASAIKRRLTKKIWLSAYVLIGEAASAERRYQYQAASISHDALLNIILSRAPFLRPAPTYSSPRAQGSEEAKTCHIAQFLRSLKMKPEAERLTQTAGTAWVFGDGQLERCRRRCGAKAALRSASKSAVRRTPRAPCLCSRIPTYRR